MYLCAYSDCSKFLYPQKAILREPHVYLSRGSHVKLSRGLMLKPWRPWQLKKPLNGPLERLPCRYTSPMYMRVFMQK